MEKKYIKKSVGQQGVFSPFKKKKNNFNSSKNKKPRNVSPEDTIR